MKFGPYNNIIDNSGAKIGQKMKILRNKNTLKDNVSKVWQIIFMGSKVVKKFVIVYRYIKITNSKEKAKFRNLLVMYFLKKNIKSITPKDDDR